MTDLPSLIAEFREKLKGVTPGPWHVGAQNDLLYIIDAPPSPAPYDGPIPREYGPTVIAKPDVDLPQGEYEAVARFIPFARNNLEALLSAAEQVVKERDEAREYGKQARLRENAAEDARIHEQHLRSKAEAENAAIRERLAEAMKKS